MAAEVIDGRELARFVREETKRRVDELRETGRSVRLDAVLAGCSEDAPSRVYAENQGRTCRELGIEYELHELEKGCTFDDVAGRVLLLNERSDVHAVMVHLPLPEGIDTYHVQSLIAPEKDIEGVNPANIGNIVYGRSSLAPCTALAVVHMIRSTGSDLRGKRCVVVGASDIVGKPVAVMLMREEATVISCNKYTPEITQFTRDADILVAAAGVTGLVDREWVKPGAVVIDVGINRIEDPDQPGKKRTVGDVVFDEVSEVAGWVSPVPGGVGPVTVAMLLRNVIASAERAYMGPQAGGTRL